MKGWLRRSLNSLSVPDREALPAVSWLFELIDQCNRVVFHRNAALVRGIGNELVLAEAKLPGALAGDEVGRGEQYRRLRRAEQLEVSLGDRRRVAVAAGFLGRVEARPAN